MNISIIIFRTFFYYILFLLLFKVMGKREIGELGVNDLLVSVLFAEFATLAISNYKEPLLVTLIPTLIIVFLQVIVSFLSLKSIKIRNLVDSSPALIMKNGNINFKEMEKQRYNLEDWARDRYASLPVKASQCIECGLCETRCPYELPIRDMLKKCTQEFGE